MEAMASCAVWIAFIPCFLALWVSLSISVFHPLFFLSLSLRKLLLHDVKFDMSVEKESLAMAMALSLIHI